MLRLQGRVLGAGAVDAHAVLVMQAQVDAEADGHAHNVPQAGGDGPQQGKAGEQQHGLQLLEAAAKAVRAVGGGRGAEEVLEVDNGRGVVLLGLVLVAGEAALLARGRRLTRLVRRGRAVVGGRVVGVGAAQDDAGANGKDYVQHVRLARGAVALAVLVDAVEHVHELAAVQDGDLGVGVLKVQLDEAGAQVAVGEGGVAEGGLGVQAEEGVAHRGAAVDEVRGVGGGLAAAVAAALRGRAGDGALDGGEDDAGKGDARGGAQVARVAGALDRDHADVGDELGELLAVVAVGVGGGDRCSGRGGAAARRVIAAGGAVAAGGGLEVGGVLGRGAAGVDGRGEVVDGLEGQLVVEQARLEVGDAGLEVPDVAARDLALGDGVVADALDGRLVARRARRQPLVAAVLAQPAAVARADVAERRRRAAAGAGAGRGGRGAGRLVRRGRVGRRGQLAVMGLVQGAFDAAHLGA